MKTTRFRFHFGQSVIMIKAVNYTMARVMVMGQRAKSGLHFACTKVEMRASFDDQWEEIENSKVTI